MESNGRPASPLDVFGGNFMAANKIKLAFLSQSRHSSLDELA